MLENDADAASNHFDQALIMSPNQIALYDSVLHQKFVAPHSSIQFEVWLAGETSAPAEQLCKHDLWRWIPQPG